MPLSNKKLQLPFIPEKTNVDFMQELLESSSLSRNSTGFLEVLVYVYRYHVSKMLAIKLDFRLQVTVVKTSKMDKVVRDSDYYTLPNVTLSQQLR